jgi:HD superfamily phosphohydrolase
MLHDISHLAFSYIIQGWYFMAVSFNYGEYYSEHYYEAKPFSSHAI